MHKQLNEENADERTTFDAAGSAGSYGSTPAAAGPDNHDQSVLQLHIPCCGLVFCIMAYFGLFFSLMQRAGLSVAVVAMVNQTAVTQDAAVDVNVSDDRLEWCPHDLAVHNGRGEFVWNRHQQAIVLSAFYYGYVVTQIPGGWTADHFGGKWLFGGSVLLSSLVSVLTPPASRIHIGVLIFLRVVAGLGEGVCVPSLHALLARWSIPAYRTMVASWIISAGDAGIVVGMLVSGVLSHYGFEGGWPSVFYVFGVVGCVWSGVWFLLCYDSPAAHPRISAAERQYWQRQIGAKDLVVQPSAQWRNVLTSVPVWALALTFFSNNWGYIMMATNVPLFMNDVLGFDITTNGALSSLLFLPSCFLIPLSAVSVDWVRSPGRLSTNVTRKVFLAAGFSLTAIFMVMATYTGCNRGLAVASSVAAIACSALSLTTVVVNQLDLAPVHAGKIMGLTHTAANLGSIGGTLSVGGLTVQGSTRREWRHVFELAAGLYALAVVVFVVFGSGNRQSWADADVNTHENELQTKDGQLQSNNRPSDADASSPKMTQN